MKGKNKDLGRIFKKLTAQGWRINIGGSGHWKLYSPDGKTIIVVSNSPRCGDTHKVRSECIRAGATL